MEIKITSKQILKVLYIIAWIIFVGLCIDAGGYITNTIYTLAFKPSLASDYWTRINFSELYTYDAGQFFVETLFMIIVAVLKAIMFYLIIKNLEKSKLDMVKPFKISLYQFIQILSYLALGIGLFSSWGVKYTIWLSQKGIKMPDIQHLNLDGAGVWLFMGVVLLVIAQIIKRGVEIQNENDLIL
jgi:Protein of unknown function (DUF2975)